MPIAWVDVPDPKNPPAGAPKLNAANLARLALIEDIGVAGTPTGNALKAAIDAEAANLFPPATVATAASFTGLDATGAADSSTALQAWLNAIPDGGLGVLPPGTYKAGGLNLTGKNVELDLRGATLVQVSDTTVLHVTGGWDTPIAVSAVVTSNQTVNALSRDLAQLTLASSPPWKTGDVIRLYSDDVISGGRPGDGTNESRRGEFGVVQAVSGTTVYLWGPTRDTYATNVRAARLQDWRVKIRGLRLETPDAGMASWTSALVQLEALNAPRIDGVTIRQGCSIGVQLVGCNAYQITGAQIRYLNNNADGNQYGYAFLDNSCENGVLEAPIVRSVRHGFTDDTNRIPASTASPSNYGKSRNASVIGGKAFGVSGSAWDTHHCGEGHTFLNCVAVECETGVNLRGLRHRVVNSFARSCRTGFAVITETAAANSFGHEFIDCYTYDALYQALSITTLNYDARQTAIVHGGVHQARTQALNVSKATVTLRGGVQLVHRAGGGITNDAMIMYGTQGVVTVDGVTLDMSAATSGSGIYLASLADATCSLTGQRLTMKLGSASAFMAGLFQGATGNPAVSISNYALDVTTLATFTGLSAASVLTNSYPSSDPVRVPTSDMQSNGGSPSLSWLGTSGADRITVYSLANGADNDLALSRRLPAEWKSVNVTLQWVNMSTGTGSVKWVLTYNQIADGDDVTANRTALTTIAAAPGANILRETLLASGITVAAAKTLALRLRRNGSDATNDTLANAAGVFGLVLTRAS